MNEKMEVYSASTKWLSQIKNNCFFCMPFAECHTAMPADIVFLVDESWSVGPTSFQQVKEFISSFMRAFQDNTLGEEGIRLGVTIYSDTPR